MNSSVIQKLKIILSNVFPGSLIPEDISNLKIGDIDEWDSLGNFNLLLGVEEEFSVKFDIEEMATIKSIEEIMTFLKKCIQG